MQEKNQLMREQNQLIKNIYQSIFPSRHLQILLYFFVIFVTKFGGFS